MPVRQPSGYSTAQIVLHWLIAALVVFQILFGENIAPAWRAFRRGVEASPAESLQANIHVVIGIAVLILATWRLALRLRHGAPPGPADERPLQKWIAGATHLVLYAAIFLLPLSGMAAWFAGIEAAGEFHELMKPVVILFVAVHTLGALWQHFVARTDVLTRMIRPAPRTRH